VARTQIVIARYITSLIQILLVLIACYLTTKLGSILQERYDDPILEVLYVPTVWIGLLIVNLLLKSFSYPAYFKYGLNRGVGILGGIHFAVLAFGGLIHWLLGGSSIQMAHIRRFLEWFSSQNEGIVVAVISFFVLLIWLSSLNLSCKLYKKRDL